MSSHNGCGFEGKSTKMLALKFHIMSNNSRELKHTREVYPRKIKLSSAHIKAFAAACDLYICKAFLIMIIGYVLQELLNINVITSVFSTPLWLLCRSAGKTTRRKYVYNCDIKFYYRAFSLSKCPPAY